ncbi:MAG: hypothetical protein ACRCYU_04310 [Nocardioides sp.]
MRVAVCSVPGAAWSGEYESVGLFVAGGPEVAASTLRVDPGTGYAEAGQMVAWVAVPVARDVLLGAWMVRGLAGVGWSELSRMSDDDVREYAIHSLVMEGADAAQVEMGTKRFAAGCRREVVEVAEYATVVAARLDRALFDPAQLPVRPPSVVVSDHTDVMPNPSFRG